MEFLDAIVAAERDLVGQIHVATKFPEDQLRTVLAMVFSYVVAFPYKLLPNVPALKHIINIVLGLFFCVYTLGPTSWVHSFVSSLIVYITLKVFSPKVSHIIVFVFCMTYMSVSHIYRQYVDYLGWTLDYTGPQMILTLKLTSLAFNYKDGTTPGTLSPDLAKRAITKLPNLLEFFGWVYFFPTFLAGPAVEIREYLAFTDLTLFSEDGKKPGKVPSTFLPSLWPFLKMAMVFPVVVLGPVYFPLNYLFGAEFDALPLLNKIPIMHFTAAHHRFKYYFGWFLAETSCVACGIGYNGKDKSGKTLWDRCTNVYPLKVELGQNMRDYTTYWNMGTANWLKNYVYVRVNSKSQTVPILATYITSAFWHGFYPGYYLFFVLAGLCTEIARECRRRIRPYFVTADEKAIQPGKLIYDIVCGFITEIHMTFNGLAFLVLSWERCFAVWYALRFWAIYTTVAAFILIRFLPRPRPAAKDANAVKKTK